MKYLKIYEEFGEMYEPMSENEFGYNPNTKVPFTVNELEQTIRLIEDKGYKLTLKEDIEKLRTWDDDDVVLLRFEKIVDNSRKSFYGTPIPAQKKCRLIVYKIEDDYFPVCLRDTEMNDRFIQHSFYKCDQIEGLVNFIKEKL